MFVFSGERMDHSLITFSSAHRLCHFQIKKSLSRHVRPFKFIISKQIQTNVATRLPLNRSINRTNLTVYDRQQWNINQRIATKRFDLILYIFGPTTDYHAASCKPMPTKSNECGQCLSVRHAFIITHR